MADTYVTMIAEESNLSQKQVANTIQLLDEGATIPFISRYRKERTDSLDEVQITAISEQLNKLREIDSRKKTILKTIEDQGKLSDELRQQIESTYSLTELEDIYLPYKPKRKTRASIAREKGLEPLAKIIMRQQELNIESKANDFLNEEVKSVEDALQGARDIIAEWINETKDPEITFEISLAGNHLFHQKL